MPRPGRDPSFAIPAALLAIAVLLAIGALLLPGSTLVLSFGAVVAAAAAAIVALLGWRAARDASAEAARAAADEARRAAEQRADAERAVAAHDSASRSRRAPKPRRCWRRASATSRRVASTPRAGGGCDGRRRAAGRSRGNGAPARSGTVGRARSARGDRGAAREAVEAERRAASELDARNTDLEQRGEEIEALRTERANLQRHRALERKWISELRSQVMTLQRDHGALGDPASIPELVLRIATTLLDGRKGLLLSRKDDDGDGDLEVLAAIGFEHDPAHSHLAQDLARRAVEADRVLRDDDVPAPRPVHRDAGRRRDPVAGRDPIYVLDRFSGIVVVATGRAASASSTRR
jgi:hypothetical protein